MIDFIHSSGHYYKQSADTATGRAYRSKSATLSDGYEMQSKQGHLGPCEDEANDERRDPPRRAWALGALRRGCGNWDSLRSPRSMHHHACSGRVARPVVSAVCCHACAVCAVLLWPRWG
eukprot:7389843-Prymnesium_polylepis.1